MALGPPAGKKEKGLQFPGLASSGLHTPSSFFFCPPVSPFQNLTLMLRLSAVTSRVWEGGRRPGRPRLQGPPPAGSGTLRRARPPVGPKLRAPSRQRPGVESSLTRARPGICC